MLRSSLPGRRMWACQRMYAGAPTFASSVSAANPATSATWRASTPKSPVAHRAVAAIASDATRPPQ